MRESSNLWDVTFGPGETSSILANNRGIAKVTPEAETYADAKYK